MYKHHIFKICALFIFFSFFTTKEGIKGQDFHYSQFYNAPFTVSPALTGIFNGDERISGSIRDQWRSVNSPWFNFSLAYDRKFYPNKAKKGFVGGGVSFNYDKQGESQLQLSNINLSGSYSRVLNQRNLITIGGMLGIASRGFNMDNLTWDRQWDPATFTVNTSGASGESFDFQRFTFMESSLGLNYRWQKTARTKLDLGVAGYHLIRPKAKFVNTETQKLPIRLAFYGMYSRELTSKLDIQVDALYQNQNTYNELLFGGYLNFYLNQRRGKEFQFRAGLGYRTRKAIFPKFGLEFNNLFIAASYDIYIDEFSRQHGGGGPELHLRYIIKHVKPLGKFKTCPIY